MSYCLSCATPSSIQMSYLKDKNASFWIRSSRLRFGAGLVEMKKGEFACFHCGVCCYVFQPQVNLNEAQALAKKLGIKWEVFKAEYTDPRWPGTQTFLLRKENGACIFLKKTPDGLSLCRIHSAKPSCCSEWQAGLDKPECREGLRFSNKSKQKRTAPGSRQEGWRVISQ